jgi:hypothetical protein
MFPKQKPIKSQKLRDSAKGQQCMVRLPGICNFMNETTVLAHLNGGGAALKKDDVQGAFACFECHREADGATRRIKDRDYVELAFRQGVERTQQYWLHNGFIKIL